MRINCRKGLITAVVIMSSAFIACGKTNKTTDSSSAEQSSASATSIVSGTSVSASSDTSAVAQEKPEYIDKTIHEFSYKVPADWIEDTNNTGDYHPSDNQDVLLSIDYWDYENSINGTGNRKDIVSSLKSDGDSEGYSYSDEFLSGDKEVAGQLSYKISDTVTKDQVKYNYTGVLLDSDGGVVEFDWYVPVDSKEQYTDEYDNIIDSITRIDPDGYTVEKYKGLSYQVPNSWNIKNTDDENYYYIDKTAIVVSFSECDTTINDSNMQSAIDVITKQVQKDENSSDITTGVKDVAGQKALVAQYKTEIDGQKVKTKIIYRFGDEGLIFWGIVYPEDADPTHESEFDALVDSITVADEESENADSATSKTKKSDTAETKKDEASGEVTPSFKEAMDSYEAFFDEYVDFMQKYKANPTDAELLAEYSDYLTKYADLMKKIDGIDEKKLSPADDAYYLEVMARITKKLSTVVQ